MEDKVITEFKVIETEDGYRIEIKGNKEQLKHMFEGRGMPFGPGRGWGHGMPHFRHHHRGFGPFGWFRHGWWGRHQGEHGQESEPTTRA